MCVCVRHLGAEGVVLGSALDALHAAAGVLVRRDLHRALQLLGDVLCALAGARTVSRLGERRQRGELRLDDLLDVLELLRGRGHELIGERVGRAAQPVHGVLQGLERVVVGVVERVLDGTHQARRLRLHLVLQALDLLGGVGIARVDGEVLVGAVGEVLHLLRQLHDAGGSMT